MVQLSCTLLDNTAVLLYNTALVLSNKPKK